MLRAGPGRRETYRWRSRHFASLHVNSVKCNLYSFYYKFVVLDSQSSFTLYFYVYALATESSLQTHKRHYVTQ